MGGTDFPKGRPTLDDLPPPVEDACAREVMLADNPHLQAELIARAYATGDSEAFQNAVLEISVLHRSIKAGVTDWYRD